MNLLVSKRVRCCISILLVFGFLFLVEADESGRIVFPDELESMRNYETTTGRLFLTPKTTKSRRPLEGGVSKLVQHSSPTSTTTATPTTTTTARPTTISATKTESDGAQQSSSEEFSSEESSSETKTATEGKIVHSSPSNASDVTWHAYEAKKTLPKYVSSAGVTEEPSVVYIQKNLIVYDSDLDDARHYSVTMPKPTCQESLQSGSTNLGEDAQTESTSKRVLHVYDSDTKSMKTIEI